MRFYARFRVADDRDGVRRLNGIFFTVFATMGLVAAAGGTILSLNVGPVLGGEFSVGELETARALFAILTVNLAITFPASIFDS